MLKNYEAGYDLTVLNCIYHKPHKTESGKWTEGSISVIFRDNVTGEKHMEEIYDPEYVYYMIKNSVIEAEHLDYTPMYIEKECCDEIIVPYRKLELDIAKRTGRENLYWECKRNKASTKLLHVLDNRVMSSDLGIENHYLARLSRVYKNTPYSITKGFLDIEIDYRDRKGAFAEPGECPVNAITYIHSNTNEVFVFLLRTKDNPLIDQWLSKGLQNVKEDFQDLLYIRLGKKTIHKYGLEDLKIRIFAYDEENELKMIGDLFSLINKRKTDFVMAWNMAFDIPYLIARIETLGGNPKEVICHPDFKEKTLLYYVDEDSEKFDRRRDYAVVSSYTIYLDQMIMYAAIRKGTKAVRSYSLDSICSKECHFGKLDYTHITPYLVELPFKDYQTFVFYNIMDVIDQVCIEQATKDIDQVFLKMLDNKTIYKNINSRSVYLVNQFREYAYTRGYILCNNLNFGNKKEEKYPGAYVAPVFLLNNYSRTKLFGTFINVFANLDDFDFSRLYPTMLQMFNLFPKALIGKLQFPDEKMNDAENISGMDKMFRREGMFVDDLATENYIEFGKRWFNLAGINKLLDDIEEYFTKFHDPGVFVPFIGKNGLTPMFNVRPNKKKMFTKRRNTLFSQVERDHKRNLYETYDISSKEAELNEEYNKYLGYDAFDTSK